MEKINFQNGVTKVNADTFNTFQNNINDAINLIKIETYSTEEQKIGTWIDGKPIYRKVYKVSNHTINSSKTEVLISDNKLNLDTLVKASSTIDLIDTNNQHNYFNISEVVNDRENMGLYIFRVLDGNLQFGTQKNLYDNYFRTIAKANIILEYTKTTD